MLFQRRLSSLLTLVPSFAAQGLSREPSSLLLQLLLLHAPGRQRLWLLHELRRQLP